MQNTIVTRYSHQRIKQIFKEDYHLTVTPIVIYKGTRYGKHMRYNLINELGKIVMYNVTLDALRMYLTSEGYPLRNI